MLTREIIEAALVRPPLGLIPSPLSAGFTGLAPAGSGLERTGTIASKPGVLVIQFEDRNMPGLLLFPERPAIYQMFIQVERVP